MTKDADATSSQFDALTDLPKWTLFVDRLKQEMIRADRDGRYIAVMSFDLDRYQPHATAFGGEFADILVETTAQRLKVSVKPYDTVTRLNEDDFIIMVGNLADPRHIERVAEKIIDGVVGQVEHHGSTALLSGSLGIAIYPRDGEDIDELVVKAQEARALVQSSGGYHFRYVTRSFQKAAERRIDLQRDLRRAIIDRAFSVDYQPIVGLNANKAVAVEAFLRWHHPQRGPVPPREILALAEEIGAAGPVGDWIADQAMADLARMRAAGAPNLRLVLNKNTNELARDGAIGQWLMAANAHGVEPGNLVLDIVEAPFLDTDRDFQPEIRAWRAEGGLIALDDFSAGAASLVPLRAGSVDWVKLDPSLTQHVDNPSAAAIVESMIEMCHRLGVRIVAEGVETAEQLAFLREKGCDMAQGFHFAPPMTFDALIASIKR